MVRVRLFLKVRNPKISRSAPWSRHLGLGACRKSVPPVENPSLNFAIYLSVNASCVN